MHGTGQPLPQPSLELQVFVTPALTDGLGRAVAGLWVAALARWLCCSLGALTQPEPASLLG